MINKQSNLAHWSFLLCELDSARGHLELLHDGMVEAGCIDESVYARHLAHVFSHLNRAWNNRDLKDDMGGDEWWKNSDFPNDLKPF